MGQNSFEDSVRNKLLLLFLFLSPIFFLNHNGAECHTVLTSVILCSLVHVGVILNLSISSSSYWCIKYFLWADSPNFIVQYLIFPPLIRQVIRLNKNVITWVILINDCNVTAESILIFKTVLICLCWYIPEVFGFKTVFVNLYVDVLPKCLFGTS